MTDIMIQTLVESFNILTPFQKKSLNMISKSVVAHPS